MSVIINQATDQTYISNLKATVETANGVFVTVDYATQTATPVVDTDAGDKTGLYIVNNVNNKIDEELVADADFVTPAGKYLRLKAPLPGFTFTTDQFAATYTTVAVNDVFAVGAGGKLVPVGARTPALTFVVKEKTTLYGKNAMKFVTVTA